MSELPDCLADLLLLHELLAQATDFEAQDIDRTCRTGKTSVTGNEAEKAVYPVSEGILVAPHNVPSH